MKKRRFNRGADELGEQELRSLNQCNWEGSNPTVEASAQSVKSGSPIGHCWKVMFLRRRPPELLHDFGGNDSRLFVVFQQGQRSAGPESLKQHGAFFPIRLQQANDATAVKEPERFDLGQVFAIGDAQLQDRLFSVRANGRGDIVVG